MAQLGSTTVYGSLTVTGEINGTANTATNYSSSGGIATALNNKISTITIGSSSDIGTVGTPSVTSSVSGGTATLVFHHLKGATGPQGPTGATGPQGPKGDKGDTGATGATGSQGPAGAAAGFGTPTATVDNAVGTPSVTVTASGSNTAKVFSFAFKNLKGATGATGAKGETGAQGPQGPAGPNFTLSAMGGTAHFLIGAPSQISNINTSKASEVYVKESNLYASGFYVVSLRKWKENIKPTEVKAVEVINNQTIVDFNLKADTLKRHKIGLIADDSDPVFLDADHKTVDLYNTCGVLLKAVQELSSEVEELRKELGTVNQRLTALESQH